MKVPCVISLFLLFVAVNALPTPGGRETKYNYHVPSGALLKVHPKGVIMVHPNGTEEFHPNDPNAVPRVPTHPIDNNTNNTKQRRDSGWVSSAWHMQSPFTYFTAQWTVPNKPNNKAGQTLFYFNSFEDTGTWSIIQPVLQYGGSAAGGGGDQWYLASWYVSSSGSSHYTGLTPVNPGDVVNGVMYQENNVWYIQCWSNKVNVQTLALQGLPVQGSAQVCMEVYSVNDCNDYPPNANLQWSNMDLQNSPGNNIYFNWDLHNDQVDCGTRTDCSGTANCETWFRGH